MKHLFFLLFLGVMTVHSQTHHFVSVDFHRKLEDFHSASFYFKSTTSNRHLHDYFGFGYHYQRSQLWTGFSLAFTSKNAIPLYSKEYISYGGGSSSAVHYTYEHTAQLDYSFIHIQPEVAAIMTSRIGKLEIQYITGGYFTLEALLNRYQHHSNSYLRAGMKKFHLSTGPLLGIQFSWEQLFFGINGQIGFQSDTYPRYWYGYNDENGYPIQLSTKLSIGYAFNGKAMMN